MKNKTLIEKRSTQTLNPQSPQRARATLLIQAFVNISSDYNMRKTVSAQT